MSLTLAQLGPIACSAFVAAMMVRLGTKTNMLVIRRPHRCVACGLQERDCRCAA
jgi:NAD-dependent dihydropyrimidine dehydrogenase PreA subunit